MTRWRAKHLHRHGGFSLIELLVSVAIFGVLSALALPHVDLRRQDVQSATKQVIADYRWARTRAITSGDHFAITWTGGSAYEIQRLKENAQGTWVVDTVVKRVQLPSHITTWFTWPATQEFNTRGMMISTTWPVWQLLYDTQFNGWHMFSVWPSGQVYEEY
ncbi:MAG: Tfp pilus assembly protein FimT/FimU [Candidatus Binatia bacterium]